MKQLLRSTKGTATHNVTLPTPGEKEILVAIYSSAISTGTETMDMRKNDLTLSEKLLEKKALFDKVNKVIKEKGLNTALKAIKNKLNPAEQSILYRPAGYSNAGIVVAKGQLVRNYNVGDRVACAGAGIASHGEFSAVPVNMAVKVPDNIPFESAAFTTIGAIAMQGIRRANVTFGETVVIVGLGLLGLIAVQIAKSWGLVVIGTDLNQDRLDLAKELGADHCLMADDADLVKKIYSATDGNGADAVIIYAGTKSSSPANQALDACRRKGRVVIVGSVGMDLKRESMYMKELDFVMSTSYGPGRYDKLYEMEGIDYPIGYVRWTENRNMMEFVRLLSDKKVDVNRLISDSFGIDRAGEAYKSLLDDSGKNIAAIFTYPHEERIVLEKRLEMNPNIKKNGKIGVGIIGAGGFIQNNHLANILELPEEYEVLAIAEKTSSSATMISESYKVKYVTTDYKQILSDKDIDLVIIGTRHNLHAKLVAECILAGKNVLVEKPLAMNNKELDMIENAVIKNPGVIATVGFNRRYSPLVQKAKSIIKTNTTPAVINYRVNGGHIPKENWVQDLEEGGGRIIGEACHFIDLIAYLASSDIESLSTIHIPPDGETVESEDNLIITLKFKNGSIGVLTYASIGGVALGKERIEIFTKGNSLVINNFTELNIYNSDEEGIVLKEPDKGHKALIIELAKLLNNKESLILPFKTDFLMSEYTILAVNQIHQTKI